MMNDLKYSFFPFFISIIIIGSSLISLPWTTIGSGFNPVENNSAIHSDQATGNDGLITGESFYTFIENVKIVPRTLNIKTIDEFNICQSIENGSYREGENGEIESFKLHELSGNGHLVDIDVEFGNMIELMGHPSPYVIPAIMNEGSYKISERWKGKDDFSSDPYFEVIENEIGNFVRIFPFQWSNGILSISRDLEIRYSTSSFDTAMEAPLASGKPTGNIDLLIVTIDDLYDTVIPFAQWKSQKGVFTEIVTMEQLRKDFPTGPDPLRIRNRVSSLESTDDLDYLLLIGDYDKVPTRITVNLFPATTLGEPTTFASDSYYACVSPGSTWDTDGDGHIAEAGELDDAIFDLAVGRLAINNEVVLSSVLTELIEREKDFQWDPTMQKVPLIAGDPANVPGDPTIIMDHFWEEYLDDIFPSANTLYYDGSGNKSFSSSSFRDLFDDQPQAMGYFSHGTQTGIPNLYSNNQVSTLPSNSLGGSFFLMACLTGWFDDPDQGNMGSFNDCFGEKMTETPGKGVVGYIGSSRLAVGNIDTIYNGDAPGLEEDYWRGIREAYNEKIFSTTGDVYRYAMNNFATNFYPFPNIQSSYSAQRTFLEYNLLGDPESPLFLKEPLELVLSYELVNDDRTVNAHVSLSNGTPVKGASVSIFRWEELGTRGITDINGNCSISIPSSNGGLVNITAYIPGYLLDNSTFSLPDTLAPTPQFSIDPEVPDGWNHTYVTEPNITIIADEPAIIQLRLNDVNMGIFNDIATILMPEGNNTISYRAVDLSGHGSMWYNLTLNVDLTPPVLKLDSDPVVPDGENGYFVSTPIISLGSIETLSEVFYRIDEGYLRQYSGPFTIAEGNHTVYIEGKDSSGILNKTVRSYLVDTITPLSSIELSHVPDGENGYYITQPMIYLGSHDENPSFIDYNWNGGNWTNFTSPLRGPLGRNRLGFRSRDSAGNYENSAGFQNIKYDPYPPEVNIEIIPDRPDGSNNTYISIPQVRVHVFDNISDRTMDQYVIVPPGVGFNWNEDSNQINGPISIPEGNWNLFILSKDLAGNQIAMKPLTFLVDTTPPNLTFEFSPEQPDGKNTWYVSPPELLIPGTIGDNTIFISFDGNHPEIITGNICLPEGIHEIEVYAVDPSGLKGAIRYFSYKCDLTDPTSVIISEKGTYFVNETIIISASSSTDEFGIELYHFRFEDQNESIWSRSPNISYSSSTPGNISVLVEIFDISGRNSTSDNLVLNILAQIDDDLNNGTDVPGLIDDPEPADTLTENKDIISIEIIYGLALFLIVMLLLSLAIIIFLRNRKIQKVDWEDEDDWMDEDWVDEVIDEGGKVVADNFEYWE